MRKSASEKKGARVTAHPVKARELLTVSEGSALWVGVPGPYVAGVHAVDDIKGAIVRLKPPPDATDEKVEQAREALLRSGAAAVRVMPRQRKDVVPQKAKRDPVPLRGPREVVMEMAEQANTEDKAALKSLLEDALSAAGL